MSELNNEQTNKENIQSFMQEDDLETSFEVKESIFDKIKAAFNRPRLGPGNNVKTTNMSFDSWSIRATFRRALEAVSNGMSNIIRKKEPEVKNGFATTVIGKDEIAATKNLDVNEKDTVQPQNIFIPGNIPGLQGKEKIEDLTQIVSQPDLLVGNVPQKEPSIKTPANELKVEEIDIDKEEIIEEKDNPTSKKQDSTIKPENINVGTQTKSTQEINRDDDHSLDI